MVPKRLKIQITLKLSFRAVLFRMVPKQGNSTNIQFGRFRAVLFRMVPKHAMKYLVVSPRFRAVLFRMVPKPRRFP